ncbi:hypothetical protein LSTR_LSTR015474 [Laodelphax striatellus]|uniref:Uncharacterized protein n=1 Tax=Laodelphax striatellus TaxID=195883 RepID=A0A482XST7_LAOST|nr:hypothetical protein LSTR_LSTR015474 [Laodelphax striatellus]
MAATPASTLADNHTTAAVVLMASNASGYQEDHDHSSATATAGLTEKQRIVLACVTALLLAICAIVIGFVLRRLMKKTSGGGVYTVEANFPLWRKRSDANSDDVCAINQQRAASVSATAAEQLKDVDAQLQESDEAWKTCSGVTSSTGVSALPDGGMTSSNSGHTVITMTMHNNHLIVETEEPQCEVADTPPLTTMASTTTTKEAAICDVSADVTQPVVVHQEAAPPDSRPPRHPSISTVLAGTGLSQAVDDLSGECEGCSPRHPYNYGGGQCEYGCQETAAPGGARRSGAPSSEPWRRATSHCPAYYKFQAQVSQDVVECGDVAAATPQPAT